MIDATDDEVKRVQRMLTSAKTARRVAAEQSRIQSNEGENKEDTSPQRGIEDAQSSQ